MVLKRRTRRDVRTQGIMVTLLLSQLDGIRKGAQFDGQRVGTAILLDSDRNAFFVGIVPPCGPNAAIIMWLGV